MTKSKNTGFGVRFEKSISELERTRYLKPIEKALMLGCHLIIAICVILLIVGGMKNYVITLALTSFACAISSHLIEKYIKGVYERASKIKDEIDVAERITEMQNNAEDISEKIPLTIGFVNLVGQHMDKMLLEDASEMSKIFAHTALGRKEIPKSQILFIYANIGSDGSFENSSLGNARQLAQKSSASIVIIATPNQPDRINKAISFPGPKIANIVFTVDRKGTAFCDFFKSLFWNMRDGREMLSCWVELAPQGPHSKSENVPVTVLAAEAGKLAFPV